MTLYLFLFAIATLLAFILDKLSRIHTGQERAQEAMTRREFLQIPPLDVAALRKSAPSFIDGGLSPAGAAPLTEPSCREIVQELSPHGIYFAHAKTSEIGPLGQRTAKAIETLGAAVLIVSDDVPQGVPVFQKLDRALRAAEGQAASPI